MRVGDFHGEAGGPGGPARRCAGEAGCGCHSRGVPVEGFVVPCLLLLLSEKPAHGYDLIDRLGRDFSLATVDPGGVYRNLGRMEADGLLESGWETAGPGPARKTYRVTQEGTELLDLWAETIARDKEMLESFLSRYEAVTRRRARRTPSGASRSGTPVVSGASASRTPNGDEEVPNGDGGVPNRDAGVPSGDGGSGVR